MTKRTRPSLALLGLLAACGGLAAPLDAASVKVVGTAYGAYLLAQTYRDYCVQQAPATAATTRQAYTSWVQAQGLGNFEAQLARLLGTANFASMQNAVAQARPGFVAALQKLGPADRVCAVYPDQLKSAQFNLKASAPGLGALLGGAAASGGARPPAQAAGAGVVYSVAQLSTLAGTVVAGLPRNTPGDRLQAAVLTRLRALGTPLVVTGTVPADEDWLSQQDELHTARWDLRCYDFADEDASLSAFHGKQVTVAGRLHDFDLDTFIELSDCRIVSAQGLKTSSLPVSDAGWRFRNQPAEKFLVAAGKGIPDAQLLAVYAQQVSSVGVGGMMILTYEPYLFLKDGTVYNDPYLAPDSFNVALSRRLEPQKWGRWTRQGKNFSIKWGNGETESFTPQLSGTPAKAGQPLSGTFSHLGGGGNTAMGGDVMVASSSSYTFTPDGRFKGGRSTGATTSNVTALSSKNTAGRYSLRGHNLTLRYDDGSDQHLLFYIVDKDMLHIGGADFLK